MDGANLQRIIQTAREDTFWSFVARVCRKLTFDTINVYAFLLSDLRSMPGPPECPPDIELCQYEGIEQLDAVVRRLGDTQLRRAVIASRLQRGDLVTMAVCRDKAIGYTWLNASGAHYVEEIGRTLIIGPRQALQYDAFVLPPFRGRGFQYLMSWPTKRYALERGFQYTLAYVDVLNTRSFASMRSHGKRVICQLLTVQLPRTTRHFNALFNRSQDFRSYNLQFCDMDALPRADAHAQERSRALPSTSRNI